MITADEFMLDVIPMVSACPDLVAKREITLAAAEYLRESSLWQEEIGPVPMIPTINEYEIEYDDAHVDRILSARLDNNELKYIPPNQTYVSTDFTPTRFTVVTKKILRVYPTPVETGMLYAVAALVPSGDDLPDLLLQHRETIKCGALSRLFRQKNTPWYDPNEAKSHREGFNDGIRDARIASVAGYGNGDLRVRPRKFV